MPLHGVGPVRQARILDLEPLEDGPGLMAICDDLGDARGPVRRGRPLLRRHALRHGLRQLLGAGQPVGSALQQSRFAEPLLVEPQGASAHLSARAASRVGVASGCRRRSSCRSGVSLRGLMGTSGRRMPRRPRGLDQFGRPEVDQLRCPEVDHFGCPEGGSVRVPLDTRRRVLAAPPAAPRGGVGSGRGARLLDLAAVEDGPRLMAGGDELGHARGLVGRGRPLLRRHALGHGVRQLDAGQPVGSALHQPHFAEPLLVELQDVSAHPSARAASRVGAPVGVAAAAPADRACSCVA